MNISQAIRCIPGGYEDLDPLTHFRCEVRGGVMQLAAWNAKLPRPTDEQIAEGWAICQAREYREKRSAEYPSLGDQMDAIWKSWTPPAGSEAEAMKAKIVAVKAKYPKGGG